ncbi:MAG: hypothetical protein C5B54_08305 [Acidobacteria bacterium]|nr:MAG: hypothetical protein C5B54_08305 [Acidobacteriota bacterium]
MWSNVTIPGKPSLLMVDATRNAEGWEYEFSDRLFSSFKRSAIELIGQSPVHVREPKELEPFVTVAFNSFVLFTDERGTDYWNWLNEQDQLGPNLFAVCMCQKYEPELARLILESSQTFAPLALAPQSPMTPREAGLFLLKFFTELKLHSEQNITGKMVWFSSSKARELLRKRRYSAKWGLRA